MDKKLHKNEREISYLEVEMLESFSKAGLRELEKLYMNRLELFEKLQADDDD